MGGILEGFSIFSLISGREKAGLFNSMRANL
jgi:hypothetical protein